MTDSYAALHKFLLPNTKLQDVMVDMNEFKNDANKPDAEADKPKAEVPKGLNASSDKPAGTKSDDNDAPSTKPSMPRKQKRYNDRINQKLTLRDERKRKQEVQAKLEKEERLNRIREATRNEVKTSSFKEDDIQRIQRVAFGVIKE